MYFLSLLISQVFFLEITDAIIRRICLCLYLPYPYYSLNIWCWPLSEDRTTEEALYSLQDGNSYILRTFCQTSQRRLLQIYHHGGLVKML